MTKSVVRTSLCFLSPVNATLYVCMHRLNWEVHHHRNLDMKNTLFGFISLCLLAISSMANSQTTCTEDYFGNVTCTGSDGSTVRGTTDYFGNETWTDDRGNSTRGTTDYFGNKTYTDNSGNTLRGTTDYFGNETWTDDRGNTTRGATDYFGALSKTGRLKRGVMWAYFT